MTTPAPQAVTVSHVVVGLGGLPVLRDVSVEIPEGTITALLGGNGAGKTTLLKTMLGLIPYQGGDIELFGIPLTRFKQWHRIGYVPQHGSLSMRQATVSEVVSTGRLSRRRPFVPPSAHDRRLVREALDTVGLSERRADAFVELSGGQQQRVLIARALAGEPEMLMLDEPFAGVDLHTQAHLAAVLRQLNESGTTIVVVLHELGDLADDIDATVHLRNGRVVPDERFAAGVSSGLGTHETTQPGPPPPLIAGIGEEA